MRAARIRPRVVRFRLQPSRDPQEQIHEACLAINWVSGGDVLMTHIQRTDQSDLLILINYFEFHEFWTWRGYPNMIQRGPEITHQTWGSA